MVDFLAVLGIVLFAAVMLGLITVFFGFVYAFVGTGVAQALFKDKANGSVGVNGSTLIGQNWSSPKWFHGRADDIGPYDNVGDDDPLVANGRSGESAATNLGPRSKVLLSNTQAPLAYWHKLGVNPHPTWSPLRAVATTPTSPRSTPPSRSPWWRAPGASPRRPCAASSRARPMGAKWVSWAAPTSSSCS